jgi:hypothetical protein
MARSSRSIPVMTRRPGRRTAGPSSCLRVSSRVAGRRRRSIDPELVDKACTRQERTLCDGSARRLRWLARCC